MDSRTVRLTTAQALVRFLSVQYSERDGVRRRLLPAVLGIFGHGNVAGLGQALDQHGDRQDASLPYLQARNEQSMVHMAAAFAKENRRLATLACTSSIGPGATNMVTGAALATISRLPVLLLPSDTYAVVLALPQDVQAEAYDYPEALFTPRTWAVARPRPEPGPIAAAAAMLAGASRPLIIA